MVMMNNPIEGTILRIMFIGYPSDQRNIIFTIFRVELCLPL